MTATEIYETVRPAYGTTWAESETNLLDDPYEHAIITILTERLTRNGNYQNPIVIVDDEPDSDDPDDIPWPSHLTVGNGMHRIIAAHRHNPNLPLPITRTWPDSNPDTPVIAVTATITNPDADADGMGSRYDDMADAIFGLWRSFPLTDTIWAESDGLAANNNTFTAYYELDAHYATAIAAALTARTNSAGYTVTNMTATAETWDDTEDTVDY